MGRIDVNPRTIRSQLVWLVGDEPSRPLPPCTGFRILPAESEHLLRPVTGLTDVNQAGVYPVRVRTRRPDGTTDGTFDVTDASWHEQQMGAGWQLVDDGTRQTGVGEPRAFVVQYASAGGLIIPAPLPNDCIPLFDSGDVAAGAQVSTPYLNLATFRELFVYAENHGLPVDVRRLRALFHAGFSGAIEKTLRRIQGGANPVNGAEYAAGMVIAYIGPNPPGGSSGSFVAYDVTSGANAALDTGPLPVEDFDALWVEARASAGTTILASYDVRDDNTSSAFGATAAVANALGAVGPGTSQTGLTANAGFATPLPRRIRFTTSAAGAGNTVRLRVIGRGRVPNIFGVHMALPQRAQFVLDAAGAAVGRIVVLGRK